MRLTVLGSGPAGLMAAQGAMDAWLRNGGEARELDVMILSLGKKSDMYGAQYLHAPIPNVTPERGEMISYQLRGDADDYRRKVYGNMAVSSVSPEDLAESHMGWDIRATYDRLWLMWRDNIHVGKVDPVGLNNLLTDRPALTISSIPRPMICGYGHRFGATEVWAAGDAPAMGIRLPYQCPNFMVICNAEESPAWYRISRVFNHTTVEWPGMLRQVPVNTAARVQKPTYTDCSCWDNYPVMFVGRYGEWSKGVLSHTAYTKAYKRIDEMMGAGSGQAAEG